MPLVRALEPLGAFTPLWTRHIRRRGVSKKLQVPCIEGFVFIPQDADIPPPGHPGPDRACVPDYWRFYSNGELATIPDKQLEPMRSIADKPVVRTADLPAKGEVRKLNGLGFEGLRATVIKCTKRECTVEVADWPAPIKVHPALLEKI